MTILKKGVIIMLQTFLTFSRRFAKPEIFDKFRPEMFDEKFRHPFFYGGFHPMIGFGLFLLVVAVVIIIAVVHKKKKGSRKAIEVLQTRYAKGEIDEEEFQSRRKVLKGK